MSKISQYPEATNLTDVKFLGNQAGATKQIPATLLGPLVYVALLSQGGTDAPTSDINKNTVGDTTIIYISPGNYSLLNPLFLKGKTWTILQKTKDSADFIIISSVDGEVTILTQNKITGDGVDEVLVNTPIKIEVYP